MTSHARSPVVDEPAELTAEWITTALCASLPDAHVRSVEREAIETGQIGASYRLTLDGTGGVPATLVAKIAAGDRAARERVAQGYQKEVGFYTVFRDRVEVRTPRCWYAAISDDLCSFVLLLDDLAPATPGVQADGCSVARARDAVQNLAGLHAPVWNDGSLYEHADWLAPMTDALAALGVEDYSFEQCFDAYRLGVLQGPMITVIGCMYATAQRSARADGMFLAMATRSCAALRDLDSFALLEA